MSAASPAIAGGLVFSGADEARSAEVAEAIAARMKPITALAMPSILARVDATAEDIADGVLRAHLLGAVSMIVGVIDLRHPDWAERALIAERASLLWASVVEASTRGETR